MGVKRCKDNKAIAQYEAEQQMAEIESPAKSLKMLASLKTTAGTAAPITEEEFGADGFKSVELNSGRDKV